MPFSQFYNSLSIPILFFRYLNKYIYLCTKKKCVSFDLTRSDCFYFIFYLSISWANRWELKVSGVGQTLLLQQKVTSFWLHKVYIQCLNSFGSWGPIWFFVHISQSWGFSLYHSSLFTVLLFCVFLSLQLCIFFFFLQHTEFCLLIGCRTCQSVFSALSSVGNSCKSIQMFNLDQIFVFIL